MHVRRGGGAGWWWCWWRGGWQLPGTRRMRVVGHEAPPRPRCCACAGAASHGHAMATEPHGHAHVRCVCACICGLLMCYVGRWLGIKKLQPHLFNPAVFYSLGV